MQTAAETKHTATPWEVREVRTQVGLAFRIGAGEMLEAGKGCCIIYDDYPGNPENERAANAAFIVRACNAYDDMLAALKELDAAVVDGLCNSGLPDFDKDRLERAQASAREIIAKAEGR